MSAGMIMLIIAGAFAGGFANGLAGFGTGLFALGWWLAAMPPLDAVITVVIMSLVGGVQGLYAVRNAIDFGEQLRFLVPALMGIMLGFLYLDAVNIIMLKLLVGSLLILFGGFFTFRKTLPKLTKRYLATDVYGRGYLLYEGVAALYLHKNFAPSTLQKVTIAIVLACRCCALRVS